MPDMVIRVNDRGDSRLISGNQMSVLTVSGETYIVMGDLNGVFAVRQTDLIAAFANMMAGFADQANGAADTDAPSPSYEISETGTETVGGRDGIVLAVRSGNDDAEREDRYVVSRDADLAPIGAALARQFTGSVEALQGFPGASDFGAHILDIFSRGTVIRLGNLFRLESVDTSPVSPSEFVLPDTVLTREEFIARMGWPERL